MNQPACSTPQPAECTPVTCHGRCAVEVIDELLSPPGAVSGEDADLLLDLRWQLRQRNDAEAVLRIFCDLRRRIEQRHYLAFFRIRRWLENHLHAVVRIGPAAELQTVRVKLDHDRVEALRRVCLCAAVGSGAAPLSTRVDFEFQDAGAPALPLTGSL